jgi:chorismate-pyruvate lyase
VHFNGGVSRSSTLELLLAGAGGTVTATLELLVGEPVDAAVSGQRAVVADGAGALAVPVGHPLLCRAATLHGRHSGRSYLEAVTLLVPSRLPAGFGDRLGSGGQPIGRLLEAEGIEVTREALAGVDPLARAVWPEVAPPPETVRLARTYRVDTGGRPVMVISEWFLTTLDRFLEAP